MAALQKFQELSKAVEQEGVGARRMYLDARRATPRRGNNFNICSTSNSRSQLTTLLLLWAIKLTDSSAKADAFAFNGSPIGINPWGDLPPYLVHA